MAFDRDRGCPEFDHLQPEPLCHLGEELCANARRQPVPKFSGFHLSDKLSLPRKDEIARRYRRRWVSIVEFIKMCLTGFAISAAIIGSAVVVIALAP